MTLADENEILEKQTIIVIPFDFHILNIFIRARLETEMLLIADDEIQNLRFAQHKNIEALRQALLPLKGAYTLAIDPGGVFDISCFKCVVTKIGCGIFEAFDLKINFVTSLGQGAD